MKKLTLIFILCLCMTPCFIAAAHGEEAGAGLNIVVASDMHYLSPNLIEGGELIYETAVNGDGKMPHRSSEIMDAFLAEVVEARPDYLILSGDLTLNGAKESHRDLVEKLAQVEKSGVVVLTIPGNHDLDGEYAVAYKDSGAEKTEALTSDEFMELYACLGPDAAVSQDGFTFSYSVDTGKGLRIIMLDANCYGKGFIKDETLAWLEEELKAAKDAGDEVITVSHQNLYAHNKLLSFGFQLYNAKALQALLEEYGVLCNLSGHIHTQNIKEGTVPEIASSALSVAPVQYGVLEYSPERLSYKAVETDVSAWAEREGIADAELLDFANYARQFFTDNCRRQVAENFAESGLSGDEIALLQESFATINLDYFAGALTDLEAIDAGLELWSEQEKSFTQMYIETMRVVENDSRSYVIDLGE